MGPYEIVAPLGAGGMGEVYRPRDTKLDRDGALKILPELSRPIPIGSRVSSGKQSCKAVGGLDTVRAKSL